MKTKIMGARPSGGNAETFYFLCSTQGETLLSTPQGDLIFQEMEKLCSYLDSLSSHPYQQLLHLQFFSETGRWEEELALIEQAIENTGSDYMKLMELDKQKTELEEKIFEAYEGMEEAEKKLSEYT